MNNQFKWAFGILIVACALATVMIMARPEPAQETKEVQSPLVETIPLELSTDTIPVSVSGTVQPRDEIVIGAQVSGRLTYVNPAFREGQFVTANSILLRIDPTDYRNQVRMAQADVAAQDVAVLEAREEVTIARDDLAKFQARENEVERLASSIDDAGYAARFLPPETLSPSGQAAGEETDPASETDAGLATREPQLRSAEAARERAAASLADAQTALNRTQISVPFSGLVREESAAVGTLVQVGQSLGSVASTSVYEVRLFLTEDEAALIPGLLRGSNGTISADVFYEYGGLTYRWPAVVDRADASLDPTTRNVEVFLRVPNPLRGGLIVDGNEGSSANEAPPLLLGAFVEARIAGDSTEGFAAIPPSALRPGNTIWVVRDGNLRIIPVRVIQRSDDFAYVAAATLSQGGELVISSLPSPTDNMPVRMADDTAQ
ncbi:MAG: HlyD family efflux transporter periplasmic adaptor subunit [Erythrobacter sp.]